jgi:hypothetical protein
MFFVSLLLQTHLFTGISSHIRENKQIAMKNARIILLRCERVLMFVIKESTAGNLITKARPRAAIEDKADLFAFNDSTDSSACSITASAPFSAECSKPRSRRMPSARGFEPASFD